MFTSIRGLRHRVAVSTAVGGVLLSSLAAVSVTTAAPALATSVAKTALINADSITTSNGIKNAKSTPISLEEYAAAAAGFKVTVVSGAAWDAMKASDFAKYQVLIVGDPFCDSTASSVTSNAAVWTAVVMGKAGGSTMTGNRVLVGTDPEDHYNPTVAGNPSTAGQEHLVEGGIAYAGGVTGATGVYFDTSCGDSTGDIPTLNLLSVTHKGFSENGSPPCGGSVALIGSNAAFAKLHTVDLAGWGCSVHTTYPTYPTDWHALAVATDTPTKPSCGIDPSTKLKACGEAYVLVAGFGLIATAPDMTVTPLKGTGTIGNTTTATVTVAHLKVPQKGVHVFITVSGANTGATGVCVPASCLTNALGKVTFTYTGKKVGADSISASATILGSGESVTASVIWTAMRYYLLNTPMIGGVYQVHYGHRYTFVADIGGTVAPHYFYATRAHLPTWWGRPYQGNKPFRSIGHGKFIMVLSITPYGMLLHPYWNIGAMDSHGVMHRLHLHVLP